MAELSKEQNALRQWLVEEWASRLAEVVASMTGVSPQIRHSPVTLDDTVASADRLWWRQPFNHPAEAVLWVGGEPRSWEVVGGRVLAAAGIEKATPENQRGTSREVLIQSLAGLAQALSTRLRKHIACNEGEEGPLPDAANVGSSFVLVLDGSEVPFYLMVTPALLSGLLKSLEKLDHRDQPAAANHTPESNSGLEPQSGRIDLLLDVELPVSVSFGRAQLSLKEVVKLTTGSIVELNRTVSEPVEVIVNNCVIARGQVVVVEGNFGIRIDHVISPQERLRTVK